MVGVALHDLALLDNALDLLDHRRAHAHCILVRPPVLFRWPIPALTFFADQGVIAVVRVVRVPHSGTASIGEGPKVEF